MSVSSEPNPTALRSKRYREKKKRGQAIRHYRTLQEQLALLQQPYSELSERDKIAVRRYRHRARRQASTPSTISTPPSHALPQLPQGTRSSSPLATLTAAAELSSTGTAPSSPTSHVTIPIPPIVTFITSPPAISSSALLVHPYEQALARSQQAGGRELNQSSLRSYTRIPQQQWESAHNFLYDHVLRSQERYKKMTLVYPMGTPKRNTGKYLSVCDTDLEQDVFPNPHGNIIQELLISSSSTTTSSSVSTPSQRLKQILPLTAHTHIQQSYSQQTVPAPRSPPTVSITTLPQQESYQRIILASTASRPTANKHIFTPSININHVKEPVVRQRLIDIAQDAQRYHQQTTPHKHQELVCDHVFSFPLDGFGIDGLQVYIKSGECVTWLHDELLWCAALNYMLKESQGCALWIAVGLHDLKQLMLLAEIDELLLTTDASKQNILEVGTLLDTLIKSEIYIEYLIQKPGQLVASPPGNGAAHLVYSYGTLMTQLAWNYSFTIPGAVQCLAYWGVDDAHEHLAIGNTSMATRTILPLFTMQSHGYELGLMDQLQSYQEMLKKLQSINKKVKITHDPKLASKSCDNCLYRQDWLRVNNQCIHCYFKNPKIRKLLH